MTFLAHTPAPEPVDTLRYEMPDYPRLVDPAPVQAIGGQLLIDGKLVCPFCLEDLGSTWCRCNPVAETVKTDIAFAGDAR